ncbi:conserved hypothetical protein [Catenulispora acidiphila DSM 44928]|uniref:DUF11 domain-containing protein n=1 Tax=Catenulispora acidiphila (strain DSM 44928 / JCM 14897 / NBRC 102108 / NRRL B-24433 / ID139908) TaxID=479433 RepID=C7QEH7_CATAD|nr:hypothetical protein [Catenulispora acidiphila]ACU70868.1 conserved hypothetical protein [Catenulispora acidiphila DSM 44928]
MIGLAAAAMLLVPTTATGAPAATAAPDLPAALSALSVAVQATGGQDVSYAIVVHNTTDHAVPDALITQQLPPSLHYITATPPPHHTGHHLTWTLTIPAHGTTRITTTSAADHHLAARPLDHTPQPGTPHRGHHQQQLTTVCVREATGPQSCATEPAAPGPHPLPRRQHAALTTTAAATTAAALLAATRLRRRRRTPRALERAGVEG